MFHRLHQHSRFAGLFLLATMALWLSTVFAGCLLPSMPQGDLRSATAAIDDAPLHEHQMAPAVTPCPGNDCAIMQSSRDRAGNDGELVPSETRPLLLSGILPLLLFITSRARRHRPAWHDPLLPRRSPALRFYALRI